MNAINGDLAAGLMDALRRVRSDDHIRVAVLTGNGRAFCAGADLRSGGGPGQLLPTAQEMAAQIAGDAPIAVRGLTEIVAGQADLTLPQAMRLGAVLRWVVGQTADVREGPRAFGEKRTPQFKGE